MSERDILLDVGGEGPGGSLSDEKRPLWKRLLSVRNIVIAACFLAFILMVVLLIVFTTRGEVLVDRVQVVNIMSHLREFQKIAEQNSNSRSVLNGYAASAAYVMDQLKKHSNCKLSTHEFTGIVTTQLANPTLKLTAPKEQTFQFGVDFAGMRYGGNRTNDVVTAPLRLIGQLGCEPTDFGQLQTGEVAVIEVVGGAGDCSLISKAVPAQEKGASAIIFANGPNISGLIGSRVRGAGWFPGDPLIEIPCLTASFTAGKTLMDAGAGAMVEITSSTRIDTPQTFNIICDSERGDPNTVIVVGAHLDGVPAGPGINDNGSGAASVLEIALQWLQFFDSQQADNMPRVRFAWWGCEEEGLIGSRNYVRDLSDEEKGRIAVALNFDMLASPNFGRFVHRGTDALEAVRTQAETIQQVFVEYFEQRNVTYELTAMRGGSDFLPFLEAAIPTGGLNTGAGGRKTIAQRELFGGVADAQYDTCYHKACDTIENIDQGCLHDMSRAAAYTLAKLAQQENLREYLKNPPAQV